MKHDVIDLFCEMAKIPSPSLCEQALAEWIMLYCTDNGIPCSPDNYGNLYIPIPATDKTKPPLVLSAHMDVVGDDSPIITYFEGDFIRARGRTLGADDKVGIAQALVLAKDLIENPVPHGGVEIVLTRDEEQEMSGVRHFDTGKLRAKYVFVLDGNRLATIETSGASYTVAKINVDTFKGGHSGSDIGDQTRENAVKLLCDLVAGLPQGVFYSDEDGKIVTSCNIGGICGGDFNVTNVININAQISYSIRSSDAEKEEELKTFILDAIESFNEEYSNNIARASVIFEETLSIFKVEDKSIPDLFKLVAQGLGLDPKIGEGHVGAETHIYQKRTNASGEKFLPYIFGTADILNKHSIDECVDYKTMVKGFEFLKAMFVAFNGMTPVSQAE